MTLLNTGALGVGFCAVKYSAGAVGSAVGDISFLISQSIVIPTCIHGRSGGLYLSLLEILRSRRGHFFSQRLDANKVLDRICCRQLSSAYWLLIGWIAVFHIERAILHRLNMSGQSDAQMASAVLHCCNWIVFIMFVFFETVNSDRCLLVMSQKTQCCDSEVLYSTLHSSMRKYRCTDSCSRFAILPLANQSAPILSLTNPIPSIVYLSQQQQCGENTCRSLRLVS